MRFVNKLRKVSRHKKYRKRRGENMSELPLTPLGRIMKNGGAERVSDDAKRALCEYLEKKSAEIAVLALENAENNNRKTLKAEDIDYAYKLL